MKLDKLNGSLANIKHLLTGKKHVVAIVGLTVVFGLFRVVGGSTPPPKAPTDAEIEARFQEEMGGALGETEAEAPVQRRANVSGSSINTDLLGDMLKSPEKDADNKGNTAQSKKPKTLIGTSAGLEDVEKSLGLR